jgi:hypothetical protein
MVTIGTDVTGVNGKQLWEKVNDNGYDRDGCDGGERKTALGKSERQWLRSGRM